MSFPALPAIGDSVEFVALVPASGFDLPFLLPNGYTVQVNGFDGIWEVDNASGTPYIVDANGSPTDNDPSRSLPYGKMVYVTAQQNSRGIPVSITDAVIWPTEFVSTADDTIFKLFANNDVDGISLGYVLADITVTGLAPTWSYTVDFTATDGGWVADLQGGNPAAVYSSGNGWVSGSSGLPDGVNVAFDALHDSHVAGGYYEVNLAAFTNFGREAGLETALGGSTIAPPLEGFNSGSAGPGLVHVDFTGVPRDMLAGQFFFIYYNTSDATAGDVRITKVHFQGTGTNPFV